MTLALDNMYPIYQKQCLKTFNHYNSISTFLQDMKKDSNDNYINDFNLTNEDKLTNNKVILLTNSYNRILETIFMSISSKSNETIFLCCFMSEKYCNLIKDYYKILSDRVKFIVMDDFLTDESYKNSTIINYYDLFNDTIVDHKRKYKLIEVLDIKEDSRGMKIINTGVSKEFTWEDRIDPQYSSYYIVNTKEDNIVRKFS